MSKHNYICDSWQGYLQQIIYQFSRGYHHYCQVNIPAHKTNKILQIDNKIINKYNTNLSKFQRYRRKNKRLVNFIYIRWETFGIIMHSNGTLDDGIIYDDIFHDIKKHPMIFQPFTISFIIHLKQDKFTLHFSKESYSSIKSVLNYSIKSSRKNILLTEYNRLNGIPCYSGIIEQKKQLLNYVISSSKKHGLMVTRDDFRLLTKRKIFKVWNDGNNNNSQKAPF